MSCVTCHVSVVSGQVSCVTCKVPYVICHFFVGQMVELVVVESVINGPIPV